MVSHDRYFMDKVVDHLLDFNGEGDIRDFPGNYTEYRGWKEASQQARLEEVRKNAGPAVPPSKPQHATESAKRKMSFKEKREFEQLEADIAALEDEKRRIEEALCGGVSDVEEITRLSKRLPDLNDELDEKSMRWLELSELL